VTQTLARRASRDLALANDPLPWASPDDFLEGSAEQPFVTQIGDTKPWGSGS